MREQVFLGVFLALYGTMTLAALIYAGRSGQPFAAAFMIWTASPILILMLRFTLELEWDIGREASTYLPSNQSWAFLFGDTIALPFTAFVLALAWRRLDVSSSRWFMSWWWLPLCVVVGLAFGYWFHFIQDGPAYINASVPEALNSPTKWAHDFVSYPVIMAGLLYLGVPVLTHLFWPYGAAGLLGIALWFAFGARDMSAGLDPSLFHPQWDTDRFSVIQ